MINLIVFSLISSILLLNSSKVWVGHILMHQEHYDTGARVQEIIDLTPSDIRFESPEFVRLLGKGRKTRDVPLLKNTANNLHIYLKENHLLDESAKCYPVFTNRNKNKLTRFGVMYILDKYCKMAQEEDPLFKTHVTPHVLRHPYVKLKLKILPACFSRIFGAKVLDFPLDFKSVIGIYAHLFDKHIGKCLC